MIDPEDVGEAGCGCFIGCAALALLLILCGVACVLFALAYKTAF